MARPGALASGVCPLEVRSAGVQARLILLTSTEDAFLRMIG